MIGFNQIFYQNEELSFSNIGTLPQTVKLLLDIEAFPKKRVVSGDYSYLLGLTKHGGYGKMYIPIYLINEEDKITFHSENKNEMRYRELGIQRHSGGWDSGGQDLFNANVRLWLK